MKSVRCCDADLRRRRRRQSISSSSSSSSVDKDCSWSPSPSCSRHRRRTREESGFECSSTRRKLHGLSTEFITTTMMLSIVFIATTTATVDAFLPPMFSSVRRMIDPTTTTKSPFTTSPQNDDIKKNKFKMRTTKAKRKMASTSRKTTSTLKITAPFKEDLKDDVLLHRRGRYAATTGQRALTHDEQMELLKLAVERRRIQQIESEMAMRNTAWSTSTKRQRMTLISKEAGYENDIDGLQDAIDEGIWARETLVTRNMGLVHFCVQNIIGSKGAAGQKQGASEVRDGNGSGGYRRLQSLMYEDLLQEGSIGLARAVDKWDLSYGTKFSSYAVYWIRAAILRCIAERDEVVRVPEHVTYAISKMTKAASHLGLDIDGEGLLAALTESATVNSNKKSMNRNSASWKEAMAAKALAEAAGLSERQLVEAMKVRKRRKATPLSFESWMQQGRNYETDHAVSASATTTSMEPPLNSNDLNYEHLKSTLAKFLRPKEVEALSWRYGFNTWTIEDDEESQEQQGASYSSKTDVVTAAATTTTTTAMDPTKKKKKKTRQPYQQAGSMTFNEVGKRMKVSTDYTRRLCHAAINKLKQAADDGTLEPTVLLSFT